MDKSVIAFKEYLKYSNNSLKISRFIPKLVDSLLKNGVIVDRNGDFVDEDAFNTEINKFLGQRVQCEDYGVFGIKRIAMASLDSHFFGGPTLNTDRFKANLTEQVEEYTLQKLKSMKENLLRNSKIPEYVFGMWEDAYKAKDADTMNEFLYKIDNCETVDDLIYVCDKMSPTVLARKNSKVNEQLHSNISHLEKDFSSQIDELEARIQNLEWEKSNLESRISELESEISNLEYRISNIEYK